MDRKKFLECCLISAAVVTFPAFASADAAAPLNVTAKLVEVPSKFPPDDLYDYAYVMRYEVIGGPLDKNAHAVVGAAAIETLRSVRADVLVLGVCSLHPEVGITVNRNTIPFDELPPTVASGIRVGTPAPTMRGFDEDDFREVGRIMCEALGADPDVAALAGRSAALLERRPLYPGMSAFPTFGI